MNEESWTRKLAARLFQPVDAAGLAYFRIVYFGVLVWEVFRMFDSNWIGKYYSGRDMYFKFWPFAFLEPLSEEGMGFALVALAVAAGMAMLGFLYRLSATVSFLLITYIFLIEQARYLNHIYLVCLIAFLMIFVPAHRYFSLDALRKKKLHSAEVPAWSIWLLRFQVAIPYFFGGVAKINHDWLRGEPLRDWLSDRTDFPILGQFYTDEPVVWTMTYGALFIDLLTPFFLLHRRTRVYAFFFLLVFHFMNSRMFGIGIFPWTMIAATIIFFEPDWPRRLLTDLRERRSGRVHAVALGGLAGFLIGGLLPDDFRFMRAIIGSLGVAVGAYHLYEPFRKASPAAAVPAAAELLPRQRQVMAWLAVWVAIQVLVPLRHFVIPGNVHWTEEGHNFAWHMKLRDKSARGTFAVTDPESGRRWMIEPKMHLSSFQRRKMLSRPDLIVEFAKFLEEDKREEGYPDVEVRAHITASLNGRDFQTFIDPEVDLTEVPQPWWGHAEWILPLEEPLRSP